MTPNEGRDAPPGRPRTAGPAVPTNKFSSFEPFALFARDIPCPGSLLAIIIGVAVISVGLWSAQPPGDARLVQVIGRHLHFHAATGGEAHPALAHLPADGGQHQVLVVQLDPEHGAGQYRRDAA